uniref:Carbonic anhydrase n=1 Tax=Davidia involucrata TaxID=16924 RepID=A0A5B7B4Z0_DAVIN
MAARVTTFILSIALLLINTYAEDGAVKFSYSGDQTGPDQWGSLSPAYSACSQGKSQTPIDIVTDKAEHNKELKPFRREYHPVNATLVNYGYSVGMDYEGNAGELILDDKKYKFKQMHWHSPSEHLINGVQYEAELHLVHASDDGNLVVVGILYKDGNADPILTKIQNKLDELAKEHSTSDEGAHIPVGIFDLKQIPQSTRSRKHYRYLGSLTTPPCSENVIWHVLGRVRTISKEQVKAIKAPLDSGCKNNSRPLQQLNGRLVELYDAAKRN